MERVECETQCFTERSPIEPFLATIDECSDGHYAMCPMHVVGHSARSGAINGIIAGGGIGGIVIAGILLLQGAVSLTLSYFVITVCTAGLIGMTLGTAWGFRQLYNHRKRQGSKS